MPIKDHLGNEFNTKVEMCKYWHVSWTVFKSRIKAGYTLERALTQKIKKINRNKYFDHLGNGYDNLDALCSHYEISLDTYKRRKDKGYTLEQILTMPHEQHVICVDHFGNTYATIRDMCRFYHISPRTYSERIRRGWSIKDALTKDIHKGSSIPIKDHKGKAYGSAKEMCRQYNMPYSVYNNRIKLGWDIKKILTTPIASKDGCYDHLGNFYNSIKEMCDKYKISLTAYYRRLNLGYNLKAILTSPSKNDIVNGFVIIRLHSVKSDGEPLFVCKCKKCGQKSIFSIAETENHKCQEKLYLITKGTKCQEKAVFDHKGNKYTSEKEMCMAYKVSLKTYRSRLRRGYSLEDALTAECRKRLTTPKNYVVYDHLGNQYDCLKEMLEFYNQSYSIYHRLIKNGCDLETALTSSDTYATIVINGVKYKNLLEASRILGFNINTVRGRMRRLGLTAEEAVNFRTAPGKTCKDHLGNVFSSIKEMCDYYGIDKSTYNGRKRLGWSLQKILETPLATNDDLIGNDYQTHCGLIFHVDEYIKNNKYRGYFIEDSKYTITTRRENIKKGTVGHPTLKTIGKGKFYGFVTDSIYMANYDKTYYRCQCQLCKYRDILTPQQMIEHSKQHGENLGN